MTINVVFYMGEDPIPVNNGVTVAVAGLAIALLKYSNVYVYNYKTKKYLVLNTFNQLESVSEKDFPELFDMVICSPILALKDYYFSGDKIIKSRYVVALLNDNYTYVLWRNFVLSIKFKSFKLKDITNFCKIPFIYLAETILCQFSNRILVQTPKDKSIFNYFLVNNDKVLVSPNGTQFTFESFQVLDFQRNGIGFVASFNDTYMKVAIWFIDNVWVNVIKLSPDIKLHVLGKNCHRVFDYVESNYPNIKSSIVVEDYHENLVDFYSKRTIVVSPIFKNYGLINKTVEAMQCGCIVIGDNAAFNGISKFESGKHGFIANDSDIFSSLIVDVNSRAESECENIRVSASSIINEQFDWNFNAINLINSLHLYR